MKISRLEHVVFRCVMSKYMTSYVYLSNRHGYDSPILASYACGEFAEGIGAATTSNGRGMVQRIDCRFCASTRLGP